MTSSTMPPLAELRAQCQALCAGEGTPYFLRRCAQSGFLFVSDFPRHAPPYRREAAVRALAGAGFVCHIPPGEALLFIDASLGRYERLLASLPPNPPPLPGGDALHPVYALCQLLLAHPAPLGEQPLLPLRRLLKLTEAPSPAPVLQAVAALHQEAALALRERRPLSHGGGQVLAAWLMAQPVPPSQTRKEESP